jgi:hypothetical protein
MKFKVSIFLYLYLFFFLANETRGQFGFSSEIGFFVGSVGFQSDYGEGAEIASDLNTGVGFGLVHYVNFAVDDRGYFNNTTFFSDRFKLRTELSYAQSDFKYAGKWIEGKPSLGKQQLAGMYGNSTMTNFGMQLEFFPRSIRDFMERKTSFAPYFSAGAQYTAYSTVAASTLGVPGSSGVTWPKYLTPTDDRPFGFSSESKSVFSFVGGFGTRYKMSDSSDLMIELRGQYYFSDWVDGLKPNPDKYKENKTNDFLIWLNVGYVYSLN